MPDDVNDETPPRFVSEIFVSPAIPCIHLPAIAASLQAFIDERCRESLPGYVWHREPLRVRFDKSDETISRLTASMRHGGSVEDEWLAVHLLLLATTSPLFTERGLLSRLEKASSDASDAPALVANVSDEDGEFLLVEAAECIPDWLQPSNAGGRLWLRDGKVHLIPLDVHPGDDRTEQSSLIEGAPLPSVTASSLLRSKADQTLAPPKLLQSLIEQRMHTFPDLAWASEFQHTTLVYLPIVAAKIVSRHPQVIADAAEAFLGRDGPNDARRLRDMSAFVQAPPSTFLVPIKLPRRLYATLLAEKYFPPKVFGSAWRESVMHSWDDEESGSNESQRQDGRRHDLGCKIACGLELAFDKARERARLPSRGMFDGSDDDARATPTYASFIRSLEAMDYFGGELRDSFAWKQRETKALELWRQSEKNDEQERSSDSLAFLLSAVASASRDRSLPPHVNLPQDAEQLARHEDPDNFLRDVPEGEWTAGTKRADDEARFAQQIGVFSKKMQSFVEGRGDEVGALFEGEGEPSDDSEEERTAEERQYALNNLVAGVPAAQWGAKSVKQRENDQNSPSNEADEEIQSDGVRKMFAMTGFSRSVKYDGATDSDESVDDDVLRAGDSHEDRASRARALDIELSFREDEERRKMDVEDGGWEDESDMSEEEFEREPGPARSDVLDFIEFTRKELGLSKDQFEDILAQRRQNGAYVPDFATRTRRKGKKMAEPTNAEPQMTFRQRTRENERKAMRNERTSEREREAARRRAEEVVRTAEEEASQRRAFKDASSSSSFESDPFAQLMNAMDAKLRTHKSKQSDEPVQSHASDDDDEDDNDEMMTEQDAELLEKMLHADLPTSLQVLLQKQHDDPHGLSTTERRVMDGMLQSYNAQQGDAGPVGALIGRFGLNRKRDFSG